MVPYINIFYYIKLILIIILKNHKVLLICED